MPAATSTAVAGLAMEAASGCETAWRDLIARFDPMLRGIVRGYRLDEADVADVVQTTWIRAYRNLDRLNDPGAIGGWLAVTARREALRALQRGVREFPAEEPQPADETAETDTPETRTLDRERRAAVRAAVGRLPGRQRLLMTTMLRRPSASYDELSTELGMPMGSIGPTRERALSRLRQDQALADLLAP
jgi:RNA polymerase sigma factor (sigma-70 family)